MSDDETPDTPDTPETPEVHPGRKKRRKAPDRKPRRATAGSGYGTSTANNVVEGVFPIRKASAAIDVPAPGTKHPDDTRKRGVIRLGKRWTEITEQVKRGEMTWDDFVSGLDEEELARGQLRDSKGRFAGRPPAVVPRPFYNACVRELMSRGAERWRLNYVSAIDVMTEIAKDRTAKPAERLKAAQFVVERIEGKVPDRLVITEPDPWQGVVEAIITDSEAGTMATAQQYLARRPGDEGTPEEQ